MRRSMVRRWEVIVGPGTRRFRMSWVESGGPPVGPSARKGFGSTLLQRMIVQTWRDCAVSHEFPSEGVRWTLEVAADTIEAG
jgi:two-component sensor histidine kinase